MLALFQNVNEIGRRSITCSTVNIIQVCKGGAVSEENIEFTSIWDVSGDRCNHLDVFTREGLITWEFGAPDALVGRPIGY